MEKNRKKVLAHYTIASAMIWAATILGCALILKGSFDKVFLIISSASALHLMIWALLASQLKKQERIAN